ncbi:MAG: hypothetical protein Ta2F_07750 [Termitinemataceae bacterium]|nr:MAG: hypothetical protein Ta2F_07750 [Termitinemataceae bacterium]
MKRVLSVFILTALCAAAICEDVSSADTPAKIKCPKKDTPEITFLLMGTLNTHSPDVSPETKHAKR